MVSRDMAMGMSESREDRYRRADRAAWNQVGLDPVERYVELADPRVRLRVMEVGDGEPLLFVHGTAGPGAWPMLVRELKGFRCVIIDRPGWGGSSELDFSKQPYGRLIADVLRGTLDGLGIDRASVIGNSIGNVWALRLAAGYPSRVSRVVLLGGGPVVPDVGVPGIIRIIASPIGAIMMRLPETPGRSRAILTGGGHGASLADGRLDAFIAWRTALGRETHSMRRERAMIRAIVAGRTYRPGLTFGDAELAAIETPTLLIYGTADPVGSETIWRRFAGRLPAGELQVMSDAGHEPWFEDAARVGDLVRDFISG